MQYRPLIISIVVAVIMLGIAGTVWLHKLSDRHAFKDTAATSTPAMQFEISDTEEKREMGLGGRATIPDNYGMLFVFPQDGNYGFWMKDMLVPIDIVWLQQNGTIVKIDGSVATSTYPAVLYPPTPIRYVLETRAGYARVHGWVPGSTVPLPAPYGTRQ